MKRISKMFCFILLFLCMIVISACAALSNEECIAVDNGCALENLSRTVVEVRAFNSIENFAFGSAIAIDS